MEVLAAISLTGTIIQFVCVGGKVLGTAREIRTSSSGMTSHNERLQKSAHYVHQLATGLKYLSSAELDVD